MTIGETIKKIREEKGMTQEELSHKLGYKTKSSISKIEKGLAEFPISKLRKIADALDVDVWEIIGFNSVVMDDTNDPANPGGMRESVMRLFNEIEAAGLSDAEADYLRAQIAGIKALRKPD